MDFLRFMHELDERIRSHNHDLAEAGLHPLRPVEVRLMGQMALLSNEEVTSQLQLFATADVDALVIGEHWVWKALEELVEEHDLELEPVASEIWVPPQAVFDTLFTSPRLVYKRLQPLYVFTSKAVKAPAKNRILVRDALRIYGESLRALIKAHGGNLAYFEKDPA